MRLGQLIADIQAAINTSKRSDDASISDRAIFSLLQSTRNLLIKTKADQQKNQNISNSNYTTLSCILMEKVSLVDCPCIEASTCKKILRSKYPIPKLLSTYFGDIVDYVSTVDGSLQFNKSGILELNQIEHYQTPYDTNDWFLEDNYLYVKPSKKLANIERIRMKAIFEDVVEVNKFKQLNCTTDEELIKNKVVCSNYDLDFSIDGDLVDMLREKVIGHIFNYHLRNFNDDINNTSNESGKTRTNYIPPPTRKTKSDS